MSVRATPTVTVSGADCGDPFELSQRTALEHERHDLPHRCRDCRCPDRGPSPAAIAKAKTWWITTDGLTEVRGWPPVVKDGHLLPRWRDVALDHHEATLSPEVEKALRESADEEELKGARVRRRATRIG